MHYEIYDNSKYGKSIALLTAISVLSGFFCCIIGEVMLPLAIAFLAALFTFERDKRVMSVITSLILLSFSIFFSVLFGVIYLYGFEIIIPSAIIAYYFRGKRGKGEAAFFVTAIITALSVASLYFSAVAQIGDNSLVAVVDFYKSFFSELEEQFVASLTSYSVQTGTGVQEALVNKETAVLLFSELINLVFSFLVIASFAIAGFSFKIYSSIVGKYSKNPDEIYRWRFSVTSVVSCFYCVVAVVSLFTSDTVSVFSVSVNNLNAIFSFVFAYLGFNFVFYLLSRKRSTAFALIALIAALLFLNTLAIDILSFVGVFFSLVINKATGGMSGGFGDDKRDSDK